MTHEPECQNYIDSVSEVEKPRPSECMFCLIAKEAYHRGREDEQTKFVKWTNDAIDASERAKEYQRGREDAAQEILMEPTVVMFDEEHPNGDLWMRRNDAYAAARGDDGWHIKDYLDASREDRL